MVGFLYFYNNNSYGYRYGFNGMEKDDEMKGEGNSYDFGARIYDPRVGRWWSIDPKVKKYPDISPFNFALDNPIFFLDPDGGEVIWHDDFKNHKNFKALIDNLSATDTYKTIYKRFLLNQDNVYFKPVPNASYWGYADPIRKANGYDLDLDFAEEGGWLTVDPTFMAKVILHEGLHHRYEMAVQEGNELNYPTLKKHLDLQRDPSQTSPSGGTYEGEHETMAEGNIGTFVKGMKEFDSNYGTEHSDDWYNAMAYRGSLERTHGFNNLDISTHTKYQSIINNETNYESFLKANATYLQDKTAANKSAMETAKGNVDWNLFNETRTKTETKTSTDSNSSETGS